MSRQYARRRSPGRVTAVAAGTVLAVLALGSGSTLSGWTTGVVADSANNLRVGVPTISHAYGQATCTSVARSTAVSCTPGLGTAALPPTTVTDSITNSGSAAVTQSVGAASCGAVQLANTSNASDPMLPRNAVTFQQSDKWGTTSAATFSNRGYASDPIGTTGSGVLGLLQNSFTVGVWFNAGDKQGGGLLSLSSSLTDGSGAASPALWLDATGNVYGHVSTTLAGTDVHTSGGNYADGSWHFAALIASTGLLGTAITLYVDGVNVSSAAGLSLLTSTRGYWHLGWASGLTAPYFHGSLSGAFVQQGALPGATVATLAGAASAAAYQGALAALSPVSIWMLGDNGFTTVPDTTLSGTLISDPCTKVNVALTFANPAASVTSQSLKAFAGAGSVAVAAPAPGATQTLTVATNQGTGYSSDLAGLHLYVPLTFTYTVPGSTSWTLSMTWSSGPAQVFWA